MSFQKTTMKKWHRVVYIIIISFMIAECIMAFFMLRQVATEIGEVKYRQFLMAVISMIFAIMLYIICFFGNVEDTRRERLFSTIIACVFLQIYLSCIIIFCGGKPDRSRLIFIFWTIVEILTVVIYGLIWYYQLETLPRKSNNRGLIFWNRSIMICFFILLIVNCFYPCYYTVRFGELYYLHPGDTIAIILYFGFIFSFLGNTLVQKCPWRKKIAIMSFFIGDILYGIMYFLLKGIGINFSTDMAAFVFNLIGIYIVFFADYVSSKEALLYAQIQTIEHERQQTELKTALMMSQIQPHFLYNALSAIRHLCKRDPDEAYEALGYFSRYLRKNLNTMQNDLISFESELEHINTYLAIEQTRFGDELKIVQDIQVTDFELPPLSVQPLVENAVRHGVCSNEDGGTVTIRTARIDDTIIITVADDGQGFDLTQIPEDGEMHIGLANVRDRLQAIVQGEMIIDSTPGKGTTVTVKIKENRK